MAIQTNFCFMKCAGFKFCENVILWKHTWVYVLLSANIYGNEINGINTLRPRQNGRHFPDDILKCIFLNENVLISIKISLKFVPKGQIDNIPSLV